MDHAPPSNESALNELWLDRRDTIIRVGEHWNRFAEENDGRAVLGEHIIGKPLHSFITGDSTRMYIEAVLRYARQSGRTIARPYRCNSPQTRRYMEMIIKPMFDGGVCMIHRLIKVEPMAKAVTFSWARETGYIGRREAPAEYAGEAGETQPDQPITAVIAEPRAPIIRCSICNRIRIDRLWMEADQAVTESRITGPHIGVLYGVCPDCQKAGINRLVGIETRP